MPRKRDDTINFIPEHKPFFSKQSQYTRRAGLEKGQVIRFMYKGKERHLFVVHPLWEGFVHGLDLKQLPRRELLMVINAPDEITSHQLYEQYVKKREVKDRDAYRCYHPHKMGGLKLIDYDSGLAPGEGSEHLVEAPQTPDATLVQDLQDTLDRMAGGDKFTTIKRKR